MLEHVDTGERQIEAYRGVAPDSILDDLIARARGLRGARVLHVNATPYGGGVSELLRSVVPLLNAAMRPDGQRRARTPWLPAPGHLAASRFARLLGAEGARKFVENGQRFFTQQRGPDELACLFAIFTFGENHKDDICDRGTHRDGAGRVMEVLGDYS
jgi:hypothetical protein